VPLLSLAGAGCFPNCRRPRVLWAGIEGETDVLAALQARLEQAMSPFVVKPETQAFRPHLTLGRVQTREQAAARRVGETIAHSELSLENNWQVEQVMLIRSRLLPGGSEYSELASCTLLPRHSGA
jgi:2'-5' RNA ligase